MPPSANDNPGRAEIFSGSRAEAGSLAKAAFRRHRERVERSALERQMWFGEYAASWQDVAALTRRVAADEASLRRRFWRKLKREAASLPFLEDVLTAHYCAFDRQTPAYVKVVLVGAIIYFILPDHLIPKYVSLIGFADDAAVIATAIKAVSSNIKPEHREAARRALERLRGA
jgi:uncharacterized membrane protein YkvA (DUF1232 family)